MRKLASVVLTLVLMVLLGSGMRWTYLNWQTLRLSAPALEGEGVPSLWQTTLNDAAGEAHALQQYKGKPLIVNFWATWCEPCREEMPEISALAQDMPQIAVIGLAVDEAPAVHAFSLTTPVHYPLLIAENEGMPLAERLGNDKGVLPYTVVIAANGRVVQTFFGRVDRKMLEEALKKTQS